MGRSGSRATAVDRHVGARIGERRRLLGLSQQQLAQVIGVTYQQAHKYEHGANRVSAGRLFEIAQALAIEPAWFFEGFGDEGNADEPMRHSRMSLEFARNFALIKDEAHLEALSRLARSLATQQQCDDSDAVTS